MLFPDSCKCLSFQEWSYVSCRLPWGRPRARSLSWSLWRDRGWDTFDLSCPFNHDLRGVLCYRLWTAYLEGISSDHTNSSLSQYATAWSDRVLAEVHQLLPGPRYLAWWLTIDQLLVADAPQVSAVAQRASPPSWGSMHCATDKSLLGSCCVFRANQLVRAQHPLDLLRQVQCQGMVLAILGCCRLYSLE